MTRGGRGRVKLRAIVAGLFSRNARNNLSHDFPCGGGSRTPLIGNSYVAINTRRKSGGSSRYSHEQEDILSSPPANRESPASSATDSYVATSRRRPRAIELCIMPNALAKQYDRLEWRGGGGGCEGLAGARREER